MYVISVELHGQPLKYHIFESLLKNSNFYAFLLLALVCTGFITTENSM
jgi:hypothetical protein